MTVSSNDNFIDPADVELEADEYTSNIDDKKDEIQDLKDNLEAEAAVEEQVEIQGQIEEAEQELKDLEVEAEDILGLHED